MFAYARTLTHQQIASTPSEPGTSRLDVAAAEFAVVDLETTGFCPDDGDRVVEIAVVRTDGRGHILREWSTLVNPGRPMDATAIHRIATADVHDAPTFGEIAGDLLTLLDGAVVVAHNAAFEERFLDAEFAAAGLAVVPLPALCTMLLARALPVPLTNHRLTTCCAHFGIDVPGAHAALADARATASLLPRALALSATTTLVFDIPVPVRLPLLLPYGGDLRARAV